MLSGQEIKTLDMSETMIEEDVVGTIYEMQDGGMIYVPSGWVKKSSRSNATTPSSFLRSSFPAISFAMIP